MQTVSPHNADKVEIVLPAVGAKQKGSESYSPLKVSIRVILTVMGAHTTKNTLVARSFLVDCDF